MTTAVSGTSSAAAAAAASSTTGSTHKTWDTMGAGDFLKLLTTQLNNQDPTAPVDNAQMVAQLAQFSALSNTAATNTTLKTISDQIAKLGGTAPSA
ncbi:flagellar hook assembly protein FlgD [Novosphingobium sp. FKTRR1]|uniref:flagellar hook assembly protein FlgD n=1 Tax=Novosphingobium sp. FKTRR1 TaxID=2879118 RepID=UPI001CF005C7|nr:flagellar hook capping FlgD N-terminal domain-containing protein [Novosphingobium sp. FKTRR1]